jgi:hypothetical protein
MKKFYILIALLFIGLFSYSQTRLYSPGLVSPVDGAVGQMPNQLLDWNPVSGTIGIHYEVQLDTSATFEHAFSLTQTELSSARPSELLFGKVYYWHVRSIDDNGTSDWSDSRSFEVVKVVVLKSPNNNANNQAPNATLKWSHATGPTVGFRGVSFIDLQLDTLASFSSPIASISPVPNPDTTLTNLSNLFFGQKYYWRMRLRNSNAISAWSDSRSFTTLGSVSLSEPTDNATNEPAVVSLSWAKIEGVTKYIITVADNPDFILASSVETTKTTLKTDTLLFGTTYYWKVQAVHPKDIASSVVRTFSTTSKVALTEPANNATGVELTPDLVWGEIAGTLEYELWLANNENFTSGLKKYMITNASLYQMPVNILKDDSTYFWKVRSLTSEDTTNWSDIWKFSVGTNGIGNLSAAGVNVLVYPNPAKNKISLSVPSAKHTNLKLSISNLIGNILISEEVQFVNGKSIADIEVNSLPNGVYFVKIQKDSFVNMSKLIIDR